MRFTLGQRRYEIEFEYPTELDTVVRLVEYDAEGGVVDVYDALVTRYWKDRPSKEKARKAALKALMAGLEWSKEDREVAWEAYLTRSPKNRYGYRLNEIVA